jgi:hypothetical protein
LSLIRQRGFLILWLGQFLVTFAAWALRTVLLIWVYKLTRSGVAVSVVGLMYPPIIASGGLSPLLIRATPRPRERPSGASVEIALAMVGEGME